MPPKSSSRLGDSKRLLLACFLGIGSFALVTWLAELLIAHNAGHWVSAIELCSTIGLVGVTAVYVVLTSRLLTVQRDQVRASAQESAVRDLIVELNRHPALISVFLPQRLHVDFWPNQKLVDETHEIFELANTIFQHSALLPSEAYAAASKASSALHITSVRLNQLIAICWQANTENIKSGSSWSVDEVRSRWEMEHQEGIFPDIGWDELMSGNVVVGACEATKSLRDHLLSLLQGEVRQSEKVQPAGDILH
jgi:hypothetical protein